MKITFSVEGDVSQEIQITDPKITPSTLQTLFDTGKVITTIQEGGTIELIESGKIIGKVLSVENNCSYSDYKVE
jgi:hypothetical protein